MYERCVNVGLPIITPIIFFNLDLKKKKCYKVVLTERLSITFKKKKNNPSHFFRDVPDVIYQPHPSAF